MINRMLWFQSKPDIMLRHFNKKQCNNVALWDLDTKILQLMAETLHHLGCMKPYK